jgi:hypothetical protein
MEGTMKLGLHLGYSGAELRVPVALVQRAEALGYDSVWTAEAYGSDAVTPLAYLAGKTERIKPALGQPLLADPGLCRDHAQDLPPQSAGQSRGP